jgi:hypothetical protein
MPENKTESGVCIVRVEVQAAHLLITVITNRDLGHNLHRARPNGEQYFTDPDTAGRSVADFIRSFAGSVEA